MKQQQLQSEQGGLGIRLEQQRGLSNATSACATSKFALRLVSLRMTIGYLDPAQPFIAFIMLAPWPILYEDNHLLVVSKPALVPTMGVEADRESILTQAKQYIKQKYAKPGEVYLGIVSRLDAPVTGVLIMARTSKAAARLTEQFRDRHVKKIYWAVVDEAIAPPSGELVNFMRKDERHRKMHIANSGDKDAQEARLAYRMLRVVRGGALFEIEPHTGRKHQIRVQLSAAGYPIVGDLKYGSDARFVKGIALHSRRLTVEHPTKREPLTFEAPLPASWKGFGIDDA